MNPDDALDRRTVLRSAAGVLLAGTLAGCSGGSGDRGSNDTGDSGTETGATGGDATTEAGTTEATTTAAATDAEPTAAGTASGDGTTDVGTTSTETTDGGTATSDATGNDTAGTTVGTGAVDEHLSSANGYDGSVADETGSDTVEVAVGAGENGFAFDPAAIRVSPGTTITWTWTGEGGAHNVVSDGDGPLDSGEPATGESVTYEATLDSPGAYPYYCEPHQSLGMKGAVVVADE